MMTIDEVGALLVFVSAFDQRTVGETDLDVWHAVAIEGRWPSFEVARRAVVKHQNARPDDRIRPGHISVIIGELRQDASRSFTRPTPPSDMRDLEQRERWLSERVEQWMAAYFAAWAEGDDNPAFRLRRQREIEGGAA